jgi:hypothetical protein
VNIEDMAEEDVCFWRWLLPVMMHHASVVQVFDDYNQQEDGKPGDTVDAPPTLVRTGRKVDGDVRLTFRRTGVIAIMQRPFCRERDARQSRIVPPEAPRFQPSAFGSQRPAPQPTLADRSDRRAESRCFEKSAPAECVLQ